MNKHAHNQHITNHHEKRRLIPDQAIVEKLLERGVDVALALE
jgi:hypothetical protein